MFCKSCGNQVADTERFCPNCGAALTPAQAPVNQPPRQAPQSVRPQPAPRAAAAPSTDGLYIGKFYLPLTKIYTILAAIASLLSFICYLCAPIGNSSSEYSVRLGKFHALFDKDMYDKTSFFYIVGAVFLGLACAYFIAQVVIAIIKKDRGDGIEIPVIPVGLHCISFLIYVITSITFLHESNKSVNEGIDAIKKLKDYYSADEYAKALKEAREGLAGPSFANILFIILTLAIVGYGVYALLKSLKKNGKFKFTFFGIGA